MAGSFGVIIGTVIGASGVTLLARIVGQGGAPITQATIGAATYSIRDRTAGAMVASGESLTVSAVIFDSLQMDSRWTQDTADSPGQDGLTGYNFMTELPASWFAGLFDVDPTTNEVNPHEVQVDVEFTPTDSTWQRFRQPWRFEPVPTWP